MSETKPYHVFISYAQENKKVAFAMCKFMEGCQLQCWIAPRNIPASKDFGTSIIEGIQASCLMIVILSEYASESKYVRNEVERAFNRGLPIIPFRIKDVQPAKSLEYFLGSSQWFDAIQGNAEDYFGSLCSVCSELLAAPIPPPPPPPLNFWERIRTKRNMAAAAVILVLVAIVLVFIITRPQTALPGRFPEASTRLLTLDDLRGKSEFDKKIMRNEIYARHGYKFKTKEMKDYFSSQSWYKPADVDTSKFSDIEKTNANFILANEK